MCPVTLKLGGTQSTTEFSVGISAGSCAVASFEVQQLDVTARTGFIGLKSVAGAGSAGSLVIDGYPSHTYQIQVRAHSTLGVVGPWATATTTVAATAKYTHAFKGLYTLNAFGGLSEASSPPLDGSAYWSGWKIARAAHVLPGSTPDSGAVLDGFGGLHSFGVAVTFTGGPYWKGFDIARDFAFLPDGSGGYVLDGYGGLHPFAVKGRPMPPAVTGAAYFRGHDLAKRVVIFSDGAGGYVLDAYGGVHPFGIGKNPVPASVQVTGYWRNWDIAQSLVLIPGTHSGYTLDGFGGLHAFAPVGQALPAAISNGPYWRGWNIARAVWLLPGSTAAAPGGYVMDGYGALHRFGNATMTPGFAYTPGNDLAIDLAGS
jgi:hypothetical protein